MAAVSAGSYILDAAGVGALVLSLGFSAVRLRQRLLPGWEGAPARLVESIVGVALLVWLSELLGVLSLLYAWSLVAAALALSGGVALAWGRGGLPAGCAERPGSGGPAEEGGGGVGAPGRRPLSPLTLIAFAAVAVVFAHWGLTAKGALDRGVFNFDSLWYHLPFAVEMATSHSVTGFHHTETVFANWLYPQNSELVHAAGILLTQRDTLSLFINFGWLAIAFLAAWCVGRPYGREPLTVVAAAVVLECHTLVVREPGAAKNDLMAAALLLAAIAILLNARVVKGVAGGGAEASRPYGWPLAAAGLAVGLAAGTKSTAFAMAAALTLAAVALAPAGRRRAAAAWWLLPALAGGGYWYLRNLLATGNPVPQLERIGPISLPHPEHLQSGRPDFSIAHYATDTAVWRDYIGPGLHHAFGALWPLVIAGAVAGGLLALFLGGDRVLRWMGAVVLTGLLAYLFTPLSASGAEGAPVGFAINIRYAVPALLAGIVLLPLAPVFGASRAPAPGEHPVDRDSGAAARAPGWAAWGLLGLLLAVLVVTDRPDAVLRDPDRLFAWGVALLFVVIPAAVLLARRRGASGGAAIAALVALALAVVAIGYPVQRDYLRDRFRNADPETSIPGMHLDSAYRWARDLSGARVGLAGTTAGFLEYGFYGTDLSNRVRYLGLEGPHGAFNAIPDCRGFREAVNAARLDYLVTAPFLNFIHPSAPVNSPEAGWLRGEPAVKAIDRSGPVTVWRVRGRLDPAACGPANEPLRRIPQQPGA
jgi:hypothetical protein